MSGDRFPVSEVPAADCSKTIAESSPIMKIALVRKEYLDVQGGAERYAVSLARGLAGLGHHVHVFAGRFHPEPHPGISLHRVPFIAWPSPLKNLSFQQRVRCMLDGSTFDIVNGLSQIFPQDVYRVGDGLHRHWLQMQTRGPLQKLRYYLSPRHQVIVQIEKKIFSPGNYRRLIVNSRMCKQQVMHYYQVPEDKIRLVYNGVDLQQFHAGCSATQRDQARTRLGIGRQDLALLFAGHNFRRKGLPFAIQCASLLARRGYALKLLVAGRGHTPPFRRIVRSSDIAGAVLFLGRVADMKALYHAADILIHPALYDPFSNVCLEAMACGLPVVTTRQNGASEIVSAGGAGVVVDNPWDVEDMAAGVACLLEQGRAGLRRMSARAAEYARAFPVEHNVQQTAAVYAEVLAEKGGRL